MKLAYNPYLSTISFKNAKKNGERRREREREREKERERERERGGGGWVD